MSRFEAVCTLLELNTKEEKLKFLSDAMSSLTTPTNSVKVGTKSVVKKGKRGRRKKVEVSETTGA